MNEPKKRESSQRVSAIQPSRSGFMICFMTKTGAADGMPYTSLLAVRMGLPSLLELDFVTARVRLEGFNLEELVRAIADRQVGVIYELDDASPAKTEAERSGKAFVRRITVTPNMLPSQPRK